MAMPIKGADSDPRDDEQVNAALLTIFDTDMIDAFGDLACLEDQRRKPRTDLEVARHDEFVQGFATHQELIRFRKSVSKTKHK
jgi:hypothetical protein